MPDNFLLEMCETPAAPSPDLGVCRCGHAGVAGSPYCFVCLSTIKHEMAVSGRVILRHTDTPEMLAALGVSRSTRWRALKRGWFTLEYHHRELIVEEGIGGFAELRDPYCFAHSQVTHILNLWDIGLEDRSLVEDMVQEGLLKCWELRHRTGVRSWPAFFSTVMRRKVQDLLPREQKYALWSDGENTEG